ncbi:hypothetical protein COU76_02595 [Candidatus Peregrinibacteria bacterium CG10_big_fil_rev_8_21_14_0_10_49_10]|nr:MAG: hypothetical protein COU76_02595 [Candidatus Peregrinibacteria bacterium CG10_big_fil_rev_8_21_14_0_10_49_10]
MRSTFRPLRATLLVHFAMTLSFAYIFLLDPASLSRMYGAVALDNMHLFLAMGFGSLMIALAIGSFLAFLHPLKNAAMILLLIIANFSLFLTDVVVLARAQMTLTTLFPEMVFYLAIAILLIRFFPEKESPKEEKPFVPDTKKEIPETKKDPVDVVTDA